MTILYSKTTNGFYDTSINASDIADDALEISPERHAALLVAQAEGMIIMAGNDGLPSVRTPALSRQDRSNCARTKRDALLHESDWVILRWLERGAKPPAQWLAYRQALRDVPEQSGFPDEIIWPEKPDA